MRGRKPIGLIVTAGLVVLWAILAGVGYALNNVFIYFIGATGLILFAGIAVGRYYALQATKLRLYGRVAVALFVIAGLIAALAVSKVLYLVVPPPPGRSAGAFVLLYLSFFTGFSTGLVLVALAAAERDV